jgi:hypothetical protein
MPGLAMEGIDGELLGMLSQFVLATDVPVLARSCRERGYGSVDGEPVLRLLRAPLAAAVLLALLQYRRAIDVRHLLLCPSVGFLLWCMHG